MKLIVENGVYYLVENPDQVYMGHGTNKDLKWVWFSGDNYPFGYGGGNLMHVGELGMTHGDIGGRDNLKYAGRIWTDKKVISFWFYPPISKLKKVIKDVEKTFNAEYGELKGKIKIDGKWKMDVTSVGEETYGDVSGSKNDHTLNNDQYGQKTYLYSLKTIFSNKPLKGIGKKWRKGEEVSTDTGQQHVAPPMLKKGKIGKMSKRQKKELYTYLKNKGKLAPDEIRMYKMLKKEGVEIFFDGERFMFAETVEDDLKKRSEKFDKKQIEMGMEVEKEHDTDDELDVVKSNIDLLKITLAHLEEDPHYYTKLKKVKESNKKHFTLEEGTGILTEAPHIAVGDQTIDLEFEKDKVAALKKVIRAILKQEITDKHGSKFKLSSAKDVQEFIKKIIKNAQVQAILKQ